MAKVSTTNDFIKRAREIHGDKYDYSKVEYINSKTKVCIICTEHGEFWQTPSDHLSGRGCPKCKNVKSSILHTKTNEQFLKEIRQIHNNKYDYSKVKYANSHKKICIICPIHGEFWTTPYILLRGN